VIGGGVLSRLCRNGVAAAALLLAGCATNGDFGRVRASLVSDDIHAWMGPAVTASIGKPYSAFQLTDDELLLRDLAYPLIEPLYDRQQWWSVLNEYGAGLSRQPYRSPLDPNGYATWLVAQEVFRSSAGVYAKLLEDIRNDITRIEPFCTVAVRVADMDRKRHKSLAHVTALSEYERKNALRRMRENALIIRWVQSSLQERAVSFRTALERLVIAIPMPTAIEAERTLTQLRQQIAAACAGPAQISARAAISEQAARRSPATSK
jgi:hypothetical protein